MDYKESNTGLSQSLRFVALFSLSYPVFSLNGKKKDSLKNEIKPRFWPNTKSVRD